VKTRVIAREQQICRIDEESVLTIDDRTQAQLVNEIKAALATVDAVVVSDYGKGVVTDQVLRAVLDGVTRHGLPVVVDPTTSDIARYAGVTVVKPNRSELLAIAGFPFDGDVDAAAAAVLGSIAPADLVVTLGADGLAVFRADGTVRIPADRHPVYDVTGAGDTVAAVLALALSVGEDIVGAATLANRAGSLSVTKAGTTPVRIEELLAEDERAVPHGR
jgi:D-beta-D-heptose 7-phosphate kinase/D-beta-D-heptose 1-phosphate adenosyltransferase